MQQPKTLSQSQRIDMEQRLHREIAERLRALSTDPAYCAAPLEGTLRAGARRRIMTHIRATYPDATKSMLQRVLLRVARDFSPTTEPTS